MITAVDTDSLLDLLIPGAPHQSRSRELLDEAANAGAVVVCDVVFAELAGFFPSLEQLDAFVATTAMSVQRIERPALHLAGQAHRQYRRVSGFACASCGAPAAFRCTSCGAAVRSRQHILSDFLIGAHAQLQADRLLTRDRGYYRTYFPALRLL